MKVSVGTVFAVIVVVLLCFSSKADALDPVPLLNLAVQQAKALTAHLISKNSLGIDYPSNSAKSGSNYETTKADSWTSGFYPGILWLLYNYTGDATLKEYAVNATEGLRSQQYNKGTHDVGFIVFTSFGTGYEVTGSSNKDYLNVILTAASSLSTRYSPIVGCIRSWNGPHFQVIIDNMMNLELLWWASQKGGSHSFFNMASSHADHMIRDCIKKDGSSYHLVDYDPTTGAVLNQSNTPQGYPGGVWSRGEAWAVYGYVKAYEYSKLKRYLDEAILTADYFLAHLSSDHIPLWDFFPPSNLPQTDTSAAAVAASALLTLSTYVPASTAHKYQQAAIDILTSLAAPPYLAPSTTDALLLHACIGYEMPNDVSLIYADFYFIEALLKLKSLL